MSEHQDTRSPEQIQRDIQQTRAEMSETLDAIRDKLSPGELLDQALNYFKSNSNDNQQGMGETASQWASSVGESIKQNPVPVALIGAGLAWLMLGGSSRTSSPSPRTRAHDPYYIGSAHDDRDVTVYDAYNAPVSDARGAQERSDGLRERAGQMASGVQERVRAAGQGVSHAAASAREGVSHAAASAREGVSHAAAGARERVSGMAASAREHAGHTTDRLRYQARQQGGKTKETFNYLRDEQPLVLGALGFALGAALGAGLPPTEREDELMGETRDQLVRRAEELGEEQLERAKHVASAASGAAMEQANREGLTQERADQTLRQTTEKLERVASASIEAAKKEANQTEQPAESTHPTPRS